jgi:hypothetical protein
VSNEARRRLFYFKEAVPILYVFGRLRRRSVLTQVADKATRPSVGKKGLLNEEEAQSATQISRELQALLSQPLLPKCVPSSVPQIKIKDFE